jgi:hypothetical protein
VSLWTGSEDPTLTVSMGEPIETGRYLFV